MVNIISETKKESHEKDFPSLDLSVCLLPCVTNFLSRDELVGLTRTNPT